MTGSNDSNSNSVHDTLVFRKAVKEDSPKLYKLQEVVYHVDYHEDLELYEELLSFNMSWVAEDSSTGDIVAYCMVHPLENYDTPPQLSQTLHHIKKFEENCAFVHDTCCHPEYRKYGVASRMFSNVVEDLTKQEKTRIALVSLKETISFWTKKGFVQAPTVVDLNITYPAGAIFMKKNTSSSASSTTLTSTST